MTNHAGVPDLLLEAENHILAILRDGPPLTLPEIPRRWPITRPMVALLVREMLADGLLAPSAEQRVPGQTAFALTDRGRRLAEARAVPRPRSAQPAYATV